MSDILKKFNVFSKISEQFKHKIKLFHVFDKNNVFIVSKEDKVFGFGSNFWGQLGFGHSNRVYKPTEIPELNGNQIKQFFDGFRFVLALNEENRVFGWGCNENGELGRGYQSGKDDYLKPEIIPNLENITEISCGFSHNLALNIDGNVFSWGQNKYGQVGYGKGIIFSNETQNNPTRLKSLPKTKSIYCFGARSFALGFNGLIYSWGSNSGYCLGHESQDNIFEPQLIIGLKNVISIGFSYLEDTVLTYFLTNEGNIYFCGTIGKNEFQKIPKILETDLKFKTAQRISYINPLFTYNSEVILALNDETVYCLEKTEIKKTKYKTILDYCLNERQITFKTIDLSFKQRFDILKYIGRGSFGEVFKVSDKIFDSDSAIKEIRYQSEDDKDELMKEVNLLSKCSTDYVVEYIGCWFEINNKFYIQMELCSDNLENIIKEKRNCFERQSTEEFSKTEYFICSHIMKEILECVQYLHELEPPIIHRDLRPANILVKYESTNRRYFKLCDFGIATLGSFYTKTLTRWKGTPPYWAPEVCRGWNYRSRYNSKADVYSLGMIICELFDLDINCSDIKSLKLNALVKIIKQMLSPTYGDRPTCAQVLSEYNDWGIENLTEKENIHLKQMNEFGNQFFINYFNEKCE